MRRRLHLRGLRPRLMLIVAAGAAIVLAGLTVAFNVVLDARLDRDVNDLLHQRAAAHLATLNTSEGRLRLPEAPDEGVVDTPIWVFAGKRLLERPVAAPVTQLAAASLAGGPRRTLEVGSRDTRLFAVPVRGESGRVGTLVAAASLVPFERSAHTTLVASIVFAVLMLAAIMLAARWAIASALRPVSVMTEQAERSSENDLDRRFSSGEPYDEVTRLAATFDLLLARLAAGLRRERSFTAEVSHELRTPLAKLVAETDLALRRERAPEEYRRALGAIARDAAEMARTLDTLLAAARAEGGSGGGTVSDARESARAAALACSDAASTHGIEIALDMPPGPVPVGADASAVERVLVPLIENGCRYATHKVTVGVSRVDGEVRLLVEDDGPGVDPQVRDRMFEAGARTVPSGNGAHDGAGLGLALARRLARALDGDIEHVDGRDGGAGFSVRLPAV